MNGYEETIRLERKFTDQIKVILAKEFIIQDAIADLKQGTDFLTFQISPFRVAARLRTFYHYKINDRKNEFTIRWGRPSGVKTEIDKIREGLVQYFFYGFVNDNETDIIQYFIADLNMFIQNEPEPDAIYPNNPHNSDLAVYKITQLPKDFIVASYGLQSFKKERSPERRGKGI